MTQTQLTQTAEIIRRVQARVGAHKYQFVLNRTPAGWEWNITGNPLHTRHVFTSAQLAIEHADLWTELWYPLPDEAYQLAMAA